jgi:hypothetical protein
VKLARSYSERQNVPLLKKIRHPFALQVSESDKGADLGVGPIPGLGWLSIVDSTSLRSFRGLDTPREIGIRILRSPSIESFEGVPPNVFGLTLKDLDVTSLRGLPALTSLGSLELEQLPRLRQVDHLGELADLGSLVIDGTGLTSLAGFSPNLQVSSGYIQANFSLSNCEAQEFATRVQKAGQPGGGISVADNGPCP